MRTRHEQSGGVWRLAIDTGGTFTDVLALSPEGERRRAKVLSSSALRTRVLGHERDRGLRIDNPWNLPRDLLRGLRARPLGSSERGSLVLGFDPSSGILTLEEALAEPPPAGSALEIVSDEQAPILGTRLVTERARDEELPPVEMRLGTTLATNALLTRRGASCALFINEGFADLLEIGNQQRPDLFALEISKPPPLYAGVFEVRGRIARNGERLQALEIERLETGAREALAQGVRSAAVALLHADLYPEDETRLAEALTAWGFEHVSVSSELAPEIRLLTRAESAVVNATLAPRVEAYLAAIRQTLGTRPLRVMTSAGGLVEGAVVRPKDMLLSGPAGGVVGAARAGARVSHRPLLAFDMGGTSADVARFAGQHDYVFEHRIGDAHLLAPALAIESVAAGGGSVCIYDARGLRVGPESAGAHPGPACYGAGGPLTLTDVNLLLGRLDPALFGIPVDRNAAERALDIVRARLAEDGEELGRDALLEGFLEIANQRMADAVRKVSIQRGYDPTDHLLVAFGGAGGQHALALAEQLGINEVLVPPDAGLLSAAGLEEARLERFVEQQFLAPLDTLASELTRSLAALEQSALDALASEGAERSRCRVRRRIAELRYEGQDATLAIEADALPDLAERFSSRYLELFGHAQPGRRIELVTLRVVASEENAELRETASPDAPEPAPSAHRSASARIGGRDVELPVHVRSELAPGARLVGPALVLEAHGATVLEEGWTLEVHEEGGLLLERRAPRAERPTSASPDAVRLELFTHRLGAIAEEMGAALQRTAVSTNVKERLDFSCAILDGQGRLVVNAPHVPVHLGSLGLCVRALSEQVELGPGDVALTNHPAFGGSHLPDVTVVEALHDDEGRAVAYVAARAHHAEIGGRRPGSMPPDATCLADEGVVLVPRIIARAGRFEWAGLREELCGAPWPSRAPDDNIADVMAAAAATHRGIQALAGLLRSEGCADFERRMRDINKRAARWTRRALRALEGRDVKTSETLDDGTRLVLHASIRGGRARIDFAGTDLQHPGNLNATPAIVRSAILYVLRLLVREPIPLNEGMLDALEIVLPRCLLNPRFVANPAECPALVGGNVEISQRLVNALVRAFGLAASSQGTMNNLLVGDESFSYYETVCGGVGAGPGFHGASGVHSHMTNTRITDPEILEHRFPLRVERFALRRGSGGSGRWRGGEGVVRELRFLAPLSLALLAQHHASGPAGLEGGGPGAPGSARLLRADGRVEILASSDGRAMQPGDRLVLETPGGGGYGKP